MSESKGLRYRKIITEDGKQKEESLVSLALAKNAKYNKLRFPDFLDIIFWMKVIFAIVIGITWGIIPLYGFIPGLAGVCFVTMMPYFYSTYYLNVDENDFDFNTILMEAVIPSNALFFLCWIVTFTCFHA
ncbi:hypothetical protein WA158_000282 [Blastocystis sp. Blastoise]